MDKVLRNPLAVAASNGDAKSVNDMLEMLKGRITPAQIEEAIGKSTSLEVTKMLEAARKMTVIENVSKKVKEGTMPYADVIKAVKNTTETNYLQQVKRDRAALGKLLDKNRIHVKNAAPSYINEEAPSHDIVWEPIGSPLDEHAEESNGNAWLEAFKDHGIDPINGSNIVDIIRQTMGKDDLDVIENLFTPESFKYENPAPNWFVIYNDDQQKMEGYMLALYCRYNPFINDFECRFLARREKDGFFSTFEYMEDGTEFNTLTSTLLSVFDEEEVNVVARHFN